MSKKIAKELADKEQTHIIKAVELSFLNDLDTVQRSFNYYLDQLKTNYLHQTALRLGYNETDQLEFTIDLKTKDGALTIKKVG